MTSDEDDGNLNARVSQLLLKVEAIDSGKTYIQNQATGHVRAVAAQEPFRRAEGSRAQAGRFQQAFDGRAHTRIVINDEHGRSACGRHSLASILVGRVK